MAVLFHQNMRAFDGGSDSRNTVYAAAFTHIRATLDAPGGAGAILVAGGTEILNNAAGARAWQDLARRLGLSQSELIASGRTALAGGPEFVGVAVHPSLQIVSSARILIEPQGKLGCLLHQDIADPLTPDWCARLPADIAPDCRGVVYVVVKSMTLPPFAVGFLHALSTQADQPAGVAAMIPQMLAHMRTNPAMQGGHGYAFLGGDFTPRPAVLGTARTGQAFPYAAGTTPDDIRNLPHGTIAGGTTLTGHLDDYWYANIDPAVPCVPFRPRGPTSPRAGYNLTTLDTCAPLSVAGPLSDHLCSMLQVS